MARYHTCDMIILCGPYGMHVLLAGKRFSSTASLASTQFLKQTFGNVRSQPTACKQARPIIGHINWIVSNCYQHHLVSRLSCLAPGLQDVHHLGTATFQVDTRRG